MSKQAIVEGHGTAGRRGDDVRSDLWVAVELAGSGGIDLRLDSKVEPYYGESICEQVRGVLSGLGVEHARVEIQDTGALPFVIEARVEAAVRRSGAGAGADVRPVMDVPAPPASEKDRLRRSRLYLPGNEPKYFVNAGLHAPDSIILDLEDSVHAAEKDAARLLVRNALRCVDFYGAERTVRVNQLPLGLEDVRTIAPEQPELLLIPKVERAGQVAEVERVLDEVADADRPIWLMPILESALGIENALDIASAGNRVAALTLGLEDYAADLGVPKSADGEESIYARQRVVNAANAAGVQAIDSVFGQVDDMDGLRRWGERSRRMGFSGMGCVHPRQVAVIHDAFNPTAAEIRKALTIVAAFDEAQARGLGVVSLGSKMIDPPVLEQARRLVDAARRSGIVPDDDGND